MVDWWAENGPPAYVGVAAYMGLIKKKKSPSKGGQTGNLEDLLTMFPTGAIQ